MKDDFRQTANVQLIPHADIIPEEGGFLVAGELGAVLEMVVKDKDGVISDSRQVKSESFLRGFAELLMLSMNAVTDFSFMRITDVSGAVQHVSSSHETFRCNAAIGNINTGIVVGTGIAPPTINDHSLAIPILHGIATGQLEYGMGTFGLPAANAAISQFTVVRAFANASLATLVVNEIGLATHAINTGNAYINVMTIRDLVVPGMSIPDGSTLTATYRIQAAI